VCVCLFVFVFVCVCVCLRVSMCVRVCVCSHITGLNDGSLNFSNDLEVTPELSSQVDLFVESNALPPVRTNYNKTVWTKYGKCVFDFRVSLV